MGVDEVLPGLHREMAGGAVLGAVAAARHQRRLLVHAALAGLGAARVEPAPGRGWMGEGTSPARMIRSRRPARSGSGTGTADSSASEYGWPRPPVELGGRGHLDELAEVHHRDPV